MTRNEHDQPIGDAVEWSPRERPSPVILEGRYVRLEPLAATHAQGIVDHLAPHPQLWTYRSDEPPADVAECARRLAAGASETDHVTFAVVRLPDESVHGMTTLLRTDERHGSTEVGSIVYSPELQRTPVTTEATYLVARHVFDELGYRRLEWKCDSLNEPSRRAAARLGFTEEGTFRNAVVTKGRNRDTTWFSITDAEWPAVRARLEAWLDPANFDADGRQRTSLSDRSVAG